MWIPSLIDERNTLDSFSALTDSEHLGAACRADTLGGRFTILHGYGLGIFHFPLGTAFHTIRLHLIIPPYCVCTRVNHTKLNVKRLTPFDWTIIGFSAGTGWLQQYAGH